MTKPNQIVTDVNDYNFEVSDQGNAAGICKQFAASQPAQLDPLVNTLNDVYRMARDTMGPAIESIKADLQDAWAGDDADKALAVIGDFTKNVDELRDNSYKIANSLNTFRSDLTSLKAQASELDSGGFGGNNDDTEAKNLYDNFVLAKNNSLDSMPNALSYWTPLGAGGGQYDNQTPGPGGPGPGPGSIPGGPGSFPGGPGTIDPGPGTIPGPSLPPGTPGPTYGPGPVHGPGPGYGPGATYGPGPGDYGSGSGYGPGVGLDTGSSLAGAGGGPGPGVGGGGAGLGGGSGLPGGGAGLDGGGSGLAGGGAAGAGGALAGGGGAGAGAAGGAAGGRGMMMPMQGGQQGGDEERERTTWLDEDDDVWGGGDAPSGVIS